MLSWTLNVMDLESVERQNEYGANLQSITGSVAGLPHKTHTHRKMLRIKPYFFLISSSCFTHTPADFAHSISSAFFLSLSLFIHYTAPPPIWSSQAQQRVWRSVSCSPCPLPLQEHQKEEDPRRVFEEPTDTPLWVVNWQMLKPHTTLSRQEEHPSHLLLYPCHWFPSQPRRLVPTVLLFVHLSACT